MALRLFDDAKLLHGLSSFITITFSPLTFAFIANISSALVWSLDPKNLKTSTRFCGPLLRSSWHLFWALVHMMHFNMSYFFCERI